MAEGGDDGFNFVMSSNSLNKGSSEEATSDRASSGLPPYVERNAVTGRFKRTVAGNVRAAGRLSRRTRSGHFKLTRLGRGTRKFNPATGKHNLLGASRSSSIEEVVPIASEALEIRPNVDELGQLVVKIRKGIRPQRIDLEENYRMIKTAVRTLEAVVPPTAELHAFFRRVKMVPSNEASLRRIIATLHEFSDLLYPLMPKAPRVGPRVSRFIASPYRDAYLWVHKALDELKVVDPARTPLPHYVGLLQTQLRSIDPGLIDMDLRAFVAQDPATVTRLQLRAVLDALEPLIAIQSRAIHGAAMANLAGPSRRGGAGGSA